MAVSRRRWLAWFTRFLLVGGLLLCLLLLLLAVLLWRQGLRLEGLGWQAGPTVAHWQWQPQGCAVLHGEGLHLAARWPLRVSLQQLTVSSCPSSDQQPFSAPEQLPALPPFFLSIDSLQLDALPALPVSVPEPLALQAQQRGGHWQLALTAAESRVELHYSDANGIWQLDGRGPLSGFVSQAQGDLAITGLGRWDGRFSGWLRVQGEALGTLGQAQRADARLELGWDGAIWRAQGALDEPLPLTGGWLLLPGEWLQARGSGLALQQFHALLRAQGPQGRVLLKANSDQAQLQQGLGVLQLSGEQLAGELAFQWDQTVFTLAPFQLQGPQALSLSSGQPIVLPLSGQGEVALPLQLSFDELVLRSKDGLLQWQGKDWRWQGDLDLQGRYAGYALRGHWQGQIDEQGASGQPLVLNVAGNDLSLRAQTRLERWRGPGSPLSIALAGRYQEWPLSGTVSVRQQQQVWQGRAALVSRLMVMSEGGELTLDSPWQWQAGQLQLGKGAVLSSRRGLIGDLLVRPFTVRSRTPLQLAVDDEGILLHGDLAVEGGGLTSAQWQVTAYQGAVQFAGRQLQSQWQLPAWQGQLNIDGRWLAGIAAGNLQLQLPMSTQLGKILGMQFTAGDVQGEGGWVWQQGLYLDSQLDFEKLAVSWGSIAASGGVGQLRLRLQDQQWRAESVGPLSLARLSTGVDITDIRAQLETDFVHWRGQDLSARVLSGTVLAPQLSWPSAQFQTIVLSGIDLAPLAALQNEPVVTLRGRIGGYLPLRLAESGRLEIASGRIANEGPVQLRLVPSARLDAMAGSNRAVKLALDSLRVLDISSLQGQVSMQEDGWLDASIHLRGVNPEKTGFPVVFNYSHKENVLDLLRSLRIGDDIAEQYRETMR